MVALKLQIALYRSLRYKLIIITLLYYKTPILKSYQLSSPHYIIDIKGARTTRRNG